MRCPSWRSCSKSAEASATRSASSSLWRFFMNTGIRSSRSFATVTRYSFSPMAAIIVGAPTPLVRDCHLVRDCQMRMDRARGVQREARLARPARFQQDLGEVKNGAEVARLELESAGEIAQAFLVALLQVVKRRPLVPGFGEVRRAPQQAREPGLGDVVAARRDVAGREIELARRGAVRVMHPDIPDAALGEGCVGCAAARQAAEQFVEERRGPRRPAQTIARDQPQNLDQASKS